MNGYDIVAIIVVILLAACLLKQQRIDRHDRERDESRAAVRNILRATGKTL